MHFYGQEYGSYPFNDYKIVFIEDAWSDISTTASMSICRCDIVCTTIAFSMLTVFCSSHLLHPPDIIDQTYHSCRILSLALARQWFGVHISQKAWPDIWLICGLANLMASFFIKRFLGMSEYRLRLKRVCDNTIGTTHQDTDLWFFTRILSCATIWMWIELRFTTKHCRHRLTQKISILLI